MKLYDMLPGLYDYFLTLFKAEYPKLVTLVAQQALKEVKNFPTALLADEITYWVSFYVSESTAPYILNATAYPNAYREENFGIEELAKWDLLIQQMAIAAMELDVKDKVKVLQETEG